MTILIPHKKCFLPLALFAIISALLMASTSGAEDSPNNPLTKIKTIRFGSHPNFSRLVVDMERKGSYKMQDDNGNKTVRLSFYSAEGTEKKDWGYKDKLIRNISTGTGEDKQSWHVLITYSTGGIKWNESYLGNPPRWIFDFSEPDKNTAEQAQDKTADKPETKKSSASNEGKHAGTLNLNPDGVKKPAEEGQKVTGKAKPYWEAQNKTQGSLKESPAAKSLKPIKKENQETSGGKTGEETSKNSESKENKPENPPKADSTPIEEKAAAPSIKDIEQDPLAIEAFNRAAILEKADKSLESGVAYKVFLEAFPKSSLAAKAHISLGDVHYAFKDLEDALAEYQMAYNNPSALNEASLKKVSFRIAEILYQTTDQTNEEIRRFYLSSWQKWPNYTDLTPQSIFNLGEIFYQQGNYAKAREFFFYAVNIYPKDVVVSQVLQRLGDSYLNEGTKEMAIKVYEEIVRRFPNDSKSLLGKFRLAELAYETNRKDLKPLEMFKEVAEKDRTSIGANALEKKAAILINDKKYLEAHQTFVEMINLFPKNDLTRKNLPLMADNLANLIKSLFEEKNYQDIIILYEQNPYMVKNIHHELYYQAIAESGLRLGYFEVAETALQDALQEKGFSKDWIYLKLAELNLEKQEYGTVDNLLKTLKEKQPQSKLIPQSHFLRGEAYFLQNRYKEASAQYKLALDLGGKMPNRIAMLYRLALSLATMKDWVGAAEAFQKVMKESNNENDANGFSYLGDAYFALGESQLAQGKKEEARKTWIEAIQLFPKHKRALDVTYQLGVLEKSTGKQKEAMNIFHQLAKDNSREFWGKAAALQIEQLEWQEKLGRDLNLVATRFR